PMTGNHHRPKTAVIVFPVVKADTVKRNWSHSIVVLPPLQIKAGERARKTSKSRLETTAAHDAPRLPRFSRRRMSILRGIPRRQLFHVRNRVKWLGQRFD